MNSFFPNISLDSAAARTATSSVAEFVRGQRPFVAFAESQDDGSRQFPALKPDAAGGDTTEIRARFDDFAQRAYLMSLHRDAIYGSATRGELLAHSLRTQTIIIYDLNHVTAHSSL